MNLVMGIFTLQMVVRRGIQQYYCQWYIDIGTGDEGWVIQNVVQLSVWLCPMEFLNHFGIYNRLHRTFHFNQCCWRLMGGKSGANDSLIRYRNEPFSIDSFNHYIAFIAFERTFSHIFRPSFTIQASRTSRRVGVTACTIFLVCRISIYSKYTRSIIRQITFEMFRKRKLFRIYVWFSVLLCDCVLCLLCLLCLKEDKLCQYLQNREHFPCSCSAFCIPFLRQSFERDNLNEKLNNINRNQIT